MTISIRLANENDQEILQHLLRKSELNIEGINESNNYFLIAEDWNDEKQIVVAIAGIEKRGEYGFLRSLVIESQVSNALAGLEFIINVIKYAKELNFKGIYLLTNSNSKYIFELLSFKRISLNEVPDEIKTSEHFLQSYNEAVVIMKNH